MARHRSLLIAGLATTVVLAGCSSDSVDRGATPAVWDYGRCALDRAIVDASHVVRLDATSGAVTSVDLVRQSDPRADVFATHPIDVGADVKLVRADGVSGLADAGTEAVALIGEPRTDLPDEWTASAIATQDAGTLKFVGPCSTEFERQFTAIRRAFSGSGDVAFLARMVDEALLPGRGADLRNVAISPAWTANEVTDPLAPRWEGGVRVVAMSVSFSPQGQGGSAGLLSDVGFYGIGLGPGLETTTVSTFAVVPKAGGVHVLIQDELGRTVATALDLADTACRDASGLYVSVNLVELTASCQPGITSDQQADLDSRTAKLGFDHSVAVPDFEAGPDGTA